MPVVKQEVNAIVGLFIFFLLDPEKSVFAKKLYSVTYLLHSITWLIYNLKGKI